MTITGLENNYYLSGNDIWITVTSQSPISVHVKNTETGKELPDFLLYPSPYGFIEFNISQLIRPLMDDATMRPFEIKISGNGEAVTFNKFFLLGWREENGNAEWFLKDGEALIVGQWLKWDGVPFPIPAQIITGSKVTDFVPNNYYIMPRKDCDYKILKFRNSLGGWQYYLFERWERKPKSKAGKVIEKIQKRLRADYFRQLPTNVRTEMTFYAKTPAEVQPVIEDLIKSSEVLLFYPEGTDLDSQWRRMKVLDNDVIVDNWNRTFENKIDFEL